MSTIYKRKSMSIFPISGVIYINISCLMSHDCKISRYDIASCLFRVYLPQFILKVLHGAWEKLQAWNATCQHELQKSHLWNLLTNNKRIKTKSDKTFNSLVEQIEFSRARVGFKPLIFLFPLITSSRLSLVFLTFPLNTTAPTFISCLEISSFLF